MSITPKSACPSALNACADFKIAYEISEALSSRWMDRSPSYPASTHKFLGIQFEYRNWENKAEGKPLLKGLIVRQVYQEIANQFKVSLHPADYTTADVVKKYSEVYAMQGEGNHRLVNVLSSTDTNQDYLYEFLEFHLPNIPDFVFIGLQDLEYLTSRFDKIYLSGTEATLGIPWYTTPEQQTVPTAVPNLKIEGNEFKTPPFPVTESAPQTGGFLGVPCPRRWFDAPEPTAN